MKKLAICLLGGLLLCGLTGAASADIYSWVDADGVRHFGNHVPPKKAVAVEITVETPYVPPSAEELLEAQKAEILAEAERKIAEMEAESLERLRSAQREIETAKQEAAQALEEAEELRKAAEIKLRSANKTVIYTGYFPYHPRKPFHKKKPAQLPTGMRKDLQHMQYEGRINHPGSKPRNPAGAGHTRAPQPHRMHRPGGFSSGSPPELSMRVR